jgi:hypothetical protein
VGGFKVNLDLGSVAVAVTAGGEAGVRSAVEFLLTEANKTVPHDEGTLERSGTATVDGLRGAVAYDTKYAAKQHEDMTAHHDGKGQPKWLENTLTGEAKTVGQIIATAIRGQVGT